MGLGLGVWLRWAAAVRADALRRRAFGFRLCKPRKTEDGGAEVQ